MWADPSLPPNVDTRQVMRQARLLLQPGERDGVQQLIGGANPKRQQEALKQHRPFMVVRDRGSWQGGRWLFVSFTSRGLA